MWTAGRHWNPPSIPFPSEFPPGLTPVAGNYTYSSSGRVSSKGGGSISFASAVGKTRRLLPCLAQSSRTVAPATRGGKSGSSQSVKLGQEDI